MPINLLYFANPMCSWCYGFHAGLEEVLAARPGAFALTVAMGSLREDTEPMTPEQKTYLENAWTRVGEASGRPFAFGLLARGDFAYDTRPACRAVAAVRSAEPARTLAYLGAVQLAFYRDSRDVTQPAVLADIAFENAIERSVVEAAFADEEGLARLYAEYQETAGLGVTGYPTLLALTRPRPTLVTHGFQPPAAVAAALDAAWAEATDTVAQ